MPSPSILDQFRRAVRSVPRLRQPLAIGAVALLTATAATAAAAPAAEAQQRVLPTWSNQLVVAPNPTGLKAMRMVYDATENVLYWVDKDGLPTVAPRTADAMERIAHATVAVVGSPKARLNRAKPADRVLLAHEPVRVLLAGDHPDIAMRMAERAREVLAGYVPLVLPTSSFARLEPGDLGYMSPEEADREAARRAEEERREREQNSFGHQVKEQVKQSGAYVVGDIVYDMGQETRDAVTRVIRRP